MAKESNLEFKVGLFVLTAFIALTMFIFSISDFSAFEKGRNIKIIFGFANGLKKSAPVRFAGVDTGLVKDIRIFFDDKENKTKVNIDVWLQAGTQIPADSTVAINQLGLLGEKYIEITPGSNRQQFLEEGQILMGKDPISVEEINEMVSKIAKKMEKSIDGFNEVVQNEENKKSLQNTLRDLSDIVAGIKEGKGTMGKFLTDESIFDNMQDFTADLKTNPWKLLYRSKR